MGHGSKMNLYIVRHGQTTTNIKNIINGRRECGLTEEGIKQAKQVKKFLKGIDFAAVISSPLERAIKTAKIICDKKIIIDERLIERNYGFLEGKKKDEEKYLECWNYKNKTDKMESVQELYTRVDNLIKELRVKYSNKNVLLVTHSGIMRMIHYYFNEIPKDGDLTKLEIPNCKIEHYKVGDKVKTLVINAGSSSLKFKMYEMPTEKVLISGNIEKIGQDAIWTIKTVKEEKYEGKVDDHVAAVRILIKSLFEKDIINSLDEIDYIGHRIVNGALEYKPEIISERVLNRLKSIASLDRVHMKGHIAGIKAFKKLIPNAVQIAFYDTAFHHTIPMENYLYAIPYEWYKNYGVRKYGFHGISCEYITKFAEKELKRKVNLIICHIGNGASITLVKNSQSINNTMGFTANAGLIMGTRCGDIDYTIIPYLREKTGKTLNQIDKMLWYESGIDGFVKGGYDNRDLQKEIEKGNKHAILIDKMYVDRVSEYIAQYYIKVDKLDGIIFCGGIGENNPIFRENVLLNLKKLGIKVDKRNNNKINKQSKVNYGIISSLTSSVPCYVIPTNEELMIARKIVDFVKEEVK